MYVCITIITASSIFVSDNECLEHKKAWRMLLHNVIVKQFVMKSTSFWLCFREGKESFQRGCLG